MSRTICRCIGLLSLVCCVACSRQSGQAPSAPATADSGSAGAPAAPAQAAGETPSPPAAVPQTATVAEAPAASVAEAPAASVAEVPAATAGDPDALVRRVAEYYQQAESLAVESEQAIVVTGAGIDNRMTTRRTIAAERPNKLAVQTTDGMAGFDFFSDGQELSLYVPTMKRYSVSPAPENFDGLLTNPLIAGGSMGGQSTFVLQLLPVDAYATMMQGVTGKEYVGTEDVGGVRAHHLRFVQEQFDWDLWTPVEGDPIVLQVSTDMSKAMSQFGGGEGRFKDLKMVSTETFRDWKRNAPIDAVAFTFKAPEGVEKVDSLFEGFGGGEEELSPLLGQPAPPVELALLDGGSLNLASHAGESIVMLDFWATWCGPCVEELPILIKVAEEYRDKGVVLYAVNQQEEPEEITKFLEEQKLTATVALDSDSTAGDDYGVQGIPMLVLIDKQGVVQSVHVGLSSSLEQELRKELDDLLAGKNISEEKLAAAKAKEKESEIKAEGLQEAWSVRGRFTGVAADQATGTIYAITRRGEVKSFDVNGQEQSSFTSPQSANALRPARLLPGSGSQLLGFGTWGDTVVAMNSDGTELWNEIGGTGIDDVWAADLDGDGQDEVLVGYNGDTGLHVFSADGSRRWKSTEIGNVWHVAAGDVSGDESVEVVTTSAEGQVHVFDADGEGRRDIAVPLYANMVRVGQALAESRKATIILSGTGTDSETVQIVAIDGEGTVQWQRELPADVSYCDSLDLDGGGAWVAAGLRGGQIVVLSSQTGEVAAQAPGFGDRIEVAWIAPSEGAAPLLLVADGRNLKAFGIVPKGEPAAE